MNLNAFNCQYQSKNAVYLTLWDRSNPVALLVFHQCVFQVSGYQHSFGGMLLTIFKVASGVWSANDMNSIGKYNKQQKRRNYLASRPSWLGVSVPCSDLLESRDDLRQVLTINGRICRARQYVTSTQKFISLMDTLEDFDCQIIYQREEITF